MNIVLNFIITDVILIGIYLTIVSYFNIQNILLHWGIAIFIISIYLIIFLYMTDRKDVVK